MIESTERFMCALEKWVAAVRANDFDRARVHAEHIVINGEKLVSHPDFIACFKRYNPAAEPMDTLISMCQFLVAATDGRARVLKQWVDKNRPADGLENSR